LLLVEFFQFAQCIRLLIFFRFHHGNQVLNKNLFLFKRFSQIVTVEHRILLSKVNPEIQYEYLSCYEGGTGQLDRMFKRPLVKREESLQRIKRNQAIYFAVFYKSNPLEVKIIYEIMPKVLLQETEKQLDRSKNAISHVGFSENWAKQNGKIVYQK
ncbi:MAG: hypothetical protein AAB740_02025, partial [Patescibacteria group bacterium]